MAGIRITNSDTKSWYAKEIGNVFGVIRETETTYLVKEGKIISHFVLKKDCEIVD